jgi:hypothetical protein
MSTSYAMSDEDADINQPILVDDLSDQETSDVMERAPRVPWIIKKAEIRISKLDNKAAMSENNPWLIKKLALQIAVGADGTDGEGANANRRVFQDYILAFNTEADPKFKSDWWQKKARGPAKELFTALGFDLKALPPIDADFLSDLNEREFVADLLKREDEKRTDQINDKGKPVYEKMGTYRNEITNHRAA